MSVGSHTHTMGKKTVLHTAAEEGKSEELQQLLDTGEYDVNQEYDGYMNVSKTREKERQRQGEVLTDFLPSHFHDVDCVR